MTTDSSILPFPHPDEIDDPLTMVLREGARRLLAQAVEAEAEAFLAAMADERLADGRARVVRHGHGPERMIQTGIGAVPVKRAKLRSRLACHLALANNLDASGNWRVERFRDSLPALICRRMRDAGAERVLGLRGSSEGAFG